MNETQAHHSQYIYQKINSVWVGLIAQFVLGMVIRWYGAAPSEPEYANLSILVKMAFVGHIINGVFLLFSSLHVILVAIRCRVGTWIRMAITGFMFILMAGSSGTVNVMISGISDLTSSIVMALGFLGAFLCYGIFFLFVQHYQKIEALEVR